MKSLWSDDAAEAMVARYGEANVGRDLALRVYTSRLLGRRSARSCCMAAATPRSRPVRRTSSATRSRCCASRAAAGTWRTIEPAGLPAVRLAPLRTLRARDALSDEDMVRMQRANLLDPARAQPVGRDAAARLPAAQIRRPHPRDRGAEPRRPARRRPSAAPRSTARRMGIVPYIMPGFALAKTAAEMFEADPAVEGLMLLKHGIFTFGDDGARSL